MRVKEGCLYEVIRNELDGTIAACPIFSTPDMFENTNKEYAEYFTYPNLEKGVDSILLDEDNWSDLHELYDWIE